VRGPSPFDCPSCLRCAPRPHPSFYYYFARLSTAQGEVLLCWSPPPPGNRPPNKALPGTRAVPCRRIKPLQKCFPNLRRNLPPTHHPPHPNIRLSRSLTAHAPIPPPRVVSSALEYFYICKVLLIPNHFFNFDPRPCAGLRKRRQTRFSLSDLARADGYPRRFPLCASPKTTSAP